MIPYDPELVQVMRKRLPRAVDRTFDPVVLKADPSKTPGKSRRHVFDFTDGMRLIVSNELGIGLHVSASFIPNTPLERRLKKALRAAGPEAACDRMRREGEDAFRRLAGPTTVLESLGFSDEKGVAHWRAPALILARTEGKE